MNNLIPDPDLSFTSPITSPLPTPHPNTATPTPQTTSTSTSPTTPPNNPASPKSEQSLQFPINHPHNHNHPPPTTDDDINQVLLAVENHYTDTHPSNHPTPSFQPFLTPPTSPTTPPPRKGIWKSTSLDYAAKLKAHRGYTQRSRAKVNDKFRTLMSVLPSPPAQVSVKHKAQILDFAVLSIMGLVERNKMLELEVVVLEGGERGLLEWVDGKVGVGEDGGLEGVLKGLVEYGVYKLGFKCCDVWKEDKEGYWNQVCWFGGRHGDRRFVGFCKESKGLRLIGDVMGYAGTCQFPMVVDCEGDLFVRKCLAKSWGVECCFVVPIESEGGGFTTGVAFYDTEARKLREETLHLVAKIAARISEHCPKLFNKLESSLPPQLRLK